MRRFRPLFWIMIAYNTCTFAEVKFTVDVTAVSAYVFRGIKQGKGPALQGTAALSIGSITSGLWLSSVNISEEIETESDFFIEAAGTAGGLEATAGVIFYSYDGFRTFNAYADHELEIYGKAAIGPAGFSVFHVPGQKSTAGDPVRSNYWLETSLHFAVLEADLSAVFGYGTYSSRYLDASKKKAVSILVLSIEKTISDSLTAKYLYSTGLDKTIKDILYLTLSWSF